MSIISKHWADSGLPFALGEEIRRLRLDRGLTQTELGWPLTRAYVSSVERGRCVPSVVALLLFATRLRVPAGELLNAVNFDLPARYNSADAERGGGLSRRRAHR
jgi:transcriptional regulator with XRE-family HTH domain